MSEPFTADQDYYTNTNPVVKGARGQALLEGDPAASFFLVAKGNTLDADMAARFGLPLKQEAKPEVKKEEEPEQFITAPAKKAPRKAAKKTDA